MSDAGKGSERRPESRPGLYGEGHDRVRWRGAETQEELVEQIAEDAFATHIKDEKRNELASEVLDAMHDKIKDAMLIPPEFLK